MKRSYDCQEKINTKWDKKLFPSSVSPCPENTQNGIILDKSQNLNDHQLNEEVLQNQTVHAKPPVLEDSASNSFRQSIALKLKTVLDGFTSQLQSISGDQHSDVADFETLQNFTHSAKSQISELLSKQQKPGVVSKDNSLPKTSSFSVDPLQIQISLKLQDLLCKALDDKLSDKNVTNSTGNSIAEADFQDLSHLLQDFLSSAKRKNSFSLAADKPPFGTVQSSAVQSACNQDKRNLFPDTDKKYCQIKNKVQKETSESTVPTMDDTDSSCDSPSGILLLGEAEKAPDYLDLSLEVEEDSDADDPGFKNADSDEEVVVLGEKKPTYQEITLDEEGEVCEKVVELQKKVRIPKDFEGLLYDCPKCDKKFRVESLLKFHIRMHSVVESHGRVAIPTTSDESENCTCPHKSKSRKEKENKLNSKSSRQHKVQKHARRKVKITS